MVTELLQYVNSMHHTIKKDDVVKNLENVLTIINDDVLPTLDGMIKNSKLEVIANSPILKNIAYGTGLKAKDNKDLLVKIKNVVSDVSKSGTKLQSVVNNELNQVVTNKTVTVKEATVLKVVSDISAMSMFIMDFNYLVLISGMNSETNYPKIKLHSIKEAVPTFSSIIKSYSKDFSKTVGNLDKLPSNSMVIDDSKVSMMDKIVSKFSKGISLPNTKGFTNNPIYHFRMWLTDRDVDKYESLKDKKKLIELKLLELKLLEEGENNPKLRKQIEYYEDKLSTMEYNMKQFEEDNE